MIRSILLSCLMSLFVAASLRADIPTVPGFHLDQPMPGTAKQTYDLLLPPAVIDAKPNTLPVIFVLSRTGKSNLWVTNLGFDDIANKNGYIMIGVNDNISSMQSAGFFRQRIEDFENYLNLADKIPQAHKTLRFVVHISPSEGGSAWALGNRYPSRIAGFILGPGPVTVMAPPAKHMAIAVLNVSRDIPIEETTHINISSHASSQTLQPMIVSRQLARKEISAYDYEIPDLFVRPKYVEPAVDWMIDAARVMNPGISEAERSAARADFTKQMTDVKTIEKPEARRLALERILALPILKGDERRDLLIAWRKAAVETAATRVDGTSRGLYLSSLANDDRMAGTPEVLAVRKELSELMKDPMIRNEVLAQQLLARVWALPEQSGTRPGSGDLTYKQRMISALNYMISQYPSTRAAETAKQRITDLEKEIAPFAARAKTVGGTGNSRSTAAGSR